MLGMLGHTPHLVDFRLRLCFFVRAPLRMRLYSFASAQCVCV
jgi:hypothetical protein